MSHKSLKHTLFHEHLLPDGQYINENKFVDIKITNKSYKTAVDADGNEYKYAECEYYNNGYLFSNIKPVCPLIVLCHNVFLCIQFKNNIVKENTLINRKLY
mgnify:CR=1 FL=1